MGPSPLVFREVPVYTFNKKQHLMLPLSPLGFTSHAVHQVQTKQTAHFVFIAGSDRTSFQQLFTRAKKQHCTALPAARVTDNRKRSWACREKRPFIITLQTGVNFLTQCKHFSWGNFRPQWEVLLARGTLLKAASSSSGVHNADSFGRKNSL